jgi:hypothetical protein
MEKRSPRKGLASLVFGIVLITMAVLALIVAFCTIVPKGNVDFPCFGLEADGCLTSYYGSERPISEARMFLCISIYPRGWSGGGAIAEGPELSDTWSGDGIALERQGEKLRVNGKLLVSGESTTWVRVRPTLNPWLLESSTTEISNRGVYDCYRTVEEDKVETQTVDVLYVDGDVGEGWLPNPLGLVILGVGIWLVVRGAKQLTSGPSERPGEPEI